MLIKIIGIEYNEVTHINLDQSTVVLQGGIKSASFSCTCGHTWRANATSNSIAPGYFALTSSSIRVKCPKCNHLHLLRQGSDY